MAAVGELQVTIRCSTWRFRAACWVALAALRLTRSPRLADWLLGVFTKYGHRLLSWRFEGAR